MKWEKKKIIICCGSGGVGKTTISAAIALKAASEGKRALVLTIDPAKRLATAMGLTELSNEPVEIDIANKRPPSGGRLFAMMLDTKRTFDYLIEKYTQSPEKSEAILKNYLYQHLSGMIAGSQEYMAMERLYDLYQEGDFDLLVLDTPPTRHALDFLEAPKKMVNLTGHSVLKWFLKPGFFAGRAGLGALQKGAEKFLAVFDRLAGFGFLHELSEMLILLSGLLGGFHDRAERVYELLRENFVGFLLVTSPSSVAIQDSLFFHEKIREYGLPFLGFIVNRIHEPGPEFRESELDSLSAPLRAKVLGYLRNHEQLALRDQKAVNLLKKMGGKKVLYAAIPLLTSDVHDLEGLQRINKKLF